MKLNFFTVFLPLFVQKDTISDGGSTALYAAYTVDTVATVYTVDTVDMVYTANMVCTVNTADTVYTIETALHC